MQDALHSTDHFPIDEILSPTSPDIFEFYDNDLFPETLNSEITSCSNVVNEDSSFSNSLPLPPDIDQLNSNPENSNNYATTTNTTASAATATDSNLSVIFGSQDELDNDISASIDFSASPPFSIPSYIPNTQEGQFEFSSDPLPDITADAIQQYVPVDNVASLIGPSLSPVFEDDWHPHLPLPSCYRLNLSTPSPLVDPNIGLYLSGSLNSTLPSDGSVNFSGSVTLPVSDIQPQELDYQGDNGGIYCTDPIQRILNSTELQALSNESQQLICGGTAPTPRSSDIATLEDSTCKVGRLSVEQRKEKIHRYMKKRNERNFSKKIKYACRKTLADSRPRVRGRFAKNDEFGENTRHTCGSSHEEEEEEEVGAKEDDIIDSPDILAHISGLNSFKINYPIQSWM